MKGICFSLTNYFSLDIFFFNLLQNYPLLSQDSWVLNDKMINKRRIEYKVVLFKLK